MPVVSTRMTRGTRKMLVNLPDVQVFFLFVSSSKLAIIHAQISKNALFLISLMKLHLVNSPPLLNFDSLPPPILLPVSILFQFRINQ